MSDTEPERPEADFGAGAHPAIIAVPHAAFLAECAAAINGRPPDQVAAMIADGWTAHVERHCILHPSMAPRGVRCGHVDCPVHGNGRATLRMEAPAEPASEAERLLVEVMTPQQGSTALLAIARRIACANQDVTANASERVRLARFVIAAAAALPNLAGAGAGRIDPRVIDRLVAMLAEVQ